MWPHQRSRGFRGNGCRHMPRRWCYWSTSRGYDWQVISHHPDCMWNHGGGMWVDRKEDACHRRSHSVANIYVLINSCDEWFDILWNPVQYHASWHKVVINHDIDIVTTLWKHTAILLKSIHWLEVNGNYHKFVIRRYTIVTAIARWVCLYAGLINAANLFDQQMNTYIGLSNLSLGITPLTSRA